MTLSLPLPLPPCSRCNILYIILYYVILYYVMLCYIILYHIVLGATGVALASGRASVAQRHSTQMYGVQGPFMIYTIVLNLLH